jgi:hypothetical protein
MTKPFMDEVRLHKQIVPDSLEHYTYFCERMAEKLIAIDEVLKIYEADTSYDCDMVRAGILSSGVRKILQGESDASPSRREPEDLE